MGKEGVRKKCEASERRAQSVSNAQATRAAGVLLLLLLLLLLGLGRAGRGRRAARGRRGLAAAAAAAADAHELGLAGLDERREVLGERREGGANGVGARGESG